MQAKQTSPGTLLCGARLASLADNGAAYGMIEKAGLAIQDGIITWVGAMANVPQRFASLPTRQLDNRMVTPGLVDCHTHLIYAGNRAREFELRLSGASYAEIARAGGGIRATVAQTRAASEAELIELALPRLDCLIREGVTTIEIKSGYGLDLASEAKMLRAARRLAEMRDITVLTSFLGAHAVPEEYDGQGDAYIDNICTEMLPSLHGEGLVDAVDGFCETIAFSPAQIRRVFETAIGLGLPIKLHAEQLSCLGGAALAAEMGAMSADHLEYLDEPGVQAMARHGVVAVVLPGAFYTLRETQPPPIAALHEAGVAVALASDSNPGSSPLTSILLAMNMGSTLFGLTPEAALAGVTRHGARALGLSDRGVIAVGKRADLCVWDIEHPAELAYRIGYNPLYLRLVAGREATSC